MKRAVPVQVSPFKEEGSLQQPFNRRAFLRSLTTAVTAGVILPGERTLRGDLLATPGGGAMRAIRLSTSGSDRATGYGMSGKVVSLHEPYLLCSWLDVSRQNQWALVDARQAEVVRRGTVGPPRGDNHCGVALCVAPDGAAHCVVGAHGGSFMHYRMAAGEEGADWQLVQEAIGEAATYPSLVCDPQGTLHLTYRRNKPTPYHVMYSCRKRDDVSWAEPRPLVRAAVPVHTWTTHAMETGPDGRLHLVVTNTQTIREGAWYFGASHIFSDDSGRSWRQLGSQAPLALPAGADTLKRIESDGFPPDRTLSADAMQKLPAAGPSQYYYFNILLSNPVIDKTGRPWVVVHNLLRGEASLYHAGNGAWIGAPLGDIVRTRLPRHNVSHMGQLARHGNGDLEIVLSAVPESVQSHRYGAAGTKLVRILADAAAAPRTCELVREADVSGIPDWLPNIQRSGSQTAMTRPALLWTRGVNSHTLTEQHTNVNEVRTEVWLQLPSAL
ncbi:MAG: BNR-4 repeat-containing protein [Thermoguttaceae bacterium]